MNSGYFFSYDYEASCIEDNLTVFRYKDLPAYLSGHYPTSPQYPISLVITGQTVKFLLHYCVYRIGRVNDKSKESIPFQFFHNLPISINKTEAETLTILHMEETLFELPYGESKESLTTIIKNLYVTLFPIPLKDDNLSNNDVDENEPSANYMIYLLRSRYENWNTSLCESLVQYRTKDIEWNTYSDLKVWGLKNNNGLFQLYDNKVINGKHKVYNKFLRKLFLDFLFDLEHGGIFQNSGYYNSMYNGLNSNFFFCSILRKSEFYFQRKLVTEIYKEKYNDNIVDINDETISIYADNLDRAERHWLACIQSPEAEKHFYFVPNWYEEALPVLDNKLNNLKQNFFTKFRINSYSWFADTEEEMQRVLFALEYANDNKIYGKKCNNVSINGDIYNSQYFSLLCKKKKSLELHNRQTDISKWFFRRYDFSDALRMSTFKYGNALLLLFLITFAALCLFTSPDQLMKVYDTITPILSYNPLTVTFITITISAIGYLIIDCCIKKNTLKEQLWERYGRVKFIVYNIIITLFLIGVYWIIPFGFDIRTAIFCILFVLMTVSLISYSDVDVYPSLFRQIHFLFPRLTASIVTAWLTIALSEDMFKAFFDLEWSWQSCLFFSVIVFIFVYYEVNKIIPKKNCIIKLFRAGQLLLISFFISVSIGLVIINFSGERMLERSDFLPNYFRDNILLQGSDKVEGQKLMLVFDSIGNDKKGMAPNELINKYTYLPDSSYTNEEAIIAIKYFANQTSYENEFTERITKIHQLRSKLVADSTRNSIKSSCKDSINKLELVKFLLKHENDKLFKDLLQYVERQDGGEHKRIAMFLGNDKNRFFILWDFLIQFAFIAMFIGIFIQLIFEEKNITET